MFSSNVSPGDQGYVSWVRPGDQGHVSWVRPGDQGYVSWVSPGDQGYVSWVRPGDQGYVSWVSPGDQGYVSWVRPGDQGYVSYTHSKNIFLTVLLAPGMSALNPSLGRRETILQREQFQGNKTGSRELFSASNHSKQQIAKP